MISVREAGKYVFSSRQVVGSSDLQGKEKVLLEIYQPLSICVDHEHASTDRVSLLEESWSCVKKHTLGRCPSVSERMHEFRVYYGRCHPRLAGGTRV